MFLNKNKIISTKIPPINNNGRILSYKPKFLTTEDSLESEMNQYKFP